MAYELSCICTAALMNFIDGRAAHCLFPGLTLHHHAFISVDGLAGSWTHSMNDTVSAEFTLNYLPDVLWPTNGTKNHTYRHEIYPGVRGVNDKRTLVIPLDGGHKPIAGSSAIQDRLVQWRINHFSSRSDHPIIAVRDTNRQRFHTWFSYAVVTKGDPASEILSGPDPYGNEEEINLDDEDEGESDVEASDVADEDPE